MTVAKPSIARIGMLVNLSIFLFAAFPYIYTITAVRLEHTAMQNQYSSVCENPISELPKMMYRMSAPPREMSFLISNSIHTSIAVRQKPDNAPKAIYLKPTVSHPPIGNNKKNGEVSRYILLVQQSTIPMNKENNVVNISMNTSYGLKLPQWI